MTKYVIREHLAGNVFGHGTASDGTVTNGEYSVLLPDGHMQVMSVGGRGWAWVGVGGRGWAWVGMGGRGWSLGIKAGMIRPGWNHLVTVLRSLSQRIHGGHRS